MSDTGRIGLGAITSRLGEAKTIDTAFRISRNTGEVTAAEHGFFSKAVRLFGPTKQDLAQNERIIESFAEGLHDAFGPEIAMAALKLARADVREEGDAFAYRRDKPLTSRQINTAMDFARSAAAGKNRDQAKHMLGTQVLRYGPGGGGFTQAAAAKGVDAKDLNDDQTLFVLNRLEEEVAYRARINEQVPDSGEIRSLAGKLALQARELGPAGAATANENVAQNKAMAHGLLEGLSGSGGDPTRSLADLMAASDDLVTRYALDPMELGTDDRVKPALSAVTNAVSELTPQAAKRMLDGLREPGSIGIKALTALERATEGVEGTHGPKISAHGQANSLLGAVVQGLADRAGEPGADEPIYNQVRRLARDRSGADSILEAMARTAQQMVNDRALVIADHERRANAEVLQHQAANH